MNKQNRNKQKKRKKAGQHTSLRVTPEYFYMNFTSTCYLSASFFMIYKAKTVINSTPLVTIEY